MLSKSESAGRRRRAACDFLNQLGHDGINVADQAVVGDVENRRFGVAVDGHDRPRVLHARQMLHGAGNAQGDVQLRGDDLAGLADLQFVRRDASVDQRPRAAGAPPNTSASRPTSRSKSSLLLNARPPETTTRASVTSGRELFFDLQPFVVCPRSQTSPHRAQSARSARRRPALPLPDRRRRGR